MSNILTIVLSLVPKWVLLPPQQRGCCKNTKGGRMKTGTVFRLALGLSLLALLASCSPTSSNKAIPESYQSSDAQQSNIIGGENADLAYAQQHGVVGIFDVVKGALCTGSLIAKDLVVTAAHCISPYGAKAMIVFFSTNIRQAVGQTPDGRMAYSKTLARQVSKAIRHENYKNETEDIYELTNDIALIRLASEAPAEFQLATLASPELAKTLHAGDKVELAGYGVMKYKTDPRTGRTIISAGSGTLRHVSDVVLKSIINSGEEVVFDQSQGRGACHGDSGGPAYFTDAATQKTVVLGVTSRGEGDCNQDTIYSSVIGQADWIAANIKKILL